MRHRFSCFLAIAALTGCRTDHILEPSFGFTVGPRSSFVQEGMLVQLTPLVADGMQVPATAPAWSSSNVSVASVNDAGLVTALSAGSAFIRANWGAEADSVEITVKRSEGSSLVAFGKTTCGATTTAGEVCWGENRYGQTGTRVAAEVVFVPTPVPAAVTWRSIGGAWNHACGVDTLFDLYCWGLNNVGQLGMGTFSDPVLPSRKVESEKKFVAVSAAGPELQASVDEETFKSQLTCALTRDGEAYCWGFTGSVQRSGEGPSNIPKPVARGIQFASISVGNAYVCGVARDRRGYCWGNNDLGQLGRETSAFDRSVGEIAGNLRFESISAGGLHACGITTDAAAYCWGANETLQLGASTISTCNFRGAPRKCSKTPVAVGGGFRFTSVVASSWGSTTATTSFVPQYREHTCGLTIDQRIVCWGTNDAERIVSRIDVNDPFELPPTLLPFGEKFLTVAVGEAHTCAVLVGGQVWCWGDWVRGQRGIPPVEHPLDINAVAGTYVFK